MSTARQQRVEFGPQAVAQHRVERGERLVEQQRARRVHERAGQRGALALAARQLARALRAPSARVRRPPASARPRRRRGRGAGCASRAQAERDVLAHAQVREQRVVLEQVAEAALRAAARRCRRPRRTAFRPSNADRPRPAAAGRRWPAASGVLPAPDGPKITVRAARALRSATRKPKRAAARWRSAMRMSTSRHHARASCAHDRRRRQPPGRQQHAMQMTEVTQHQEVRGVVLAGLHRLVDRDRQRLRLPGMLPATISVAPNSPIARAKASSMPARMPRQASGSVTRKNTAHSRQAEHPRAARAAGRRLERGARGLQHQRERDDRRGDHRALPAEDQRDAEALLQPARRASRACRSRPAGSSRARSAAAPAAA